MPRNKRSSGPARSSPGGEHVLSEPSWRVAEKLRFWCPLCGMVADLDRLDGSPYPVRLKLQRYGGRLRGGTGYMEYIPVDQEERKKLLDRLAALVLALPSHIREEAEIALETFSDWCREAAHRNPGLSGRALALAALAAAISEEAGTETSPEELSSRFGRALAGASPDADFADLARVMARDLTERLGSLPYFRATDERAVQASAFAASRLEVRTRAEDEAASELRQERIRRGTRRYLEFLRANAGRMLAAEREEFEEAKERALAALERERISWEGELREVETLARELERDLDLVTAVHTLAGLRIPAELPKGVEELLSSVGRAKRHAEIFARARANVEAMAFEEHLESLGKSIVKDAWELVKEEGK